MSFSGGVLCIFGSRTLVPVSWMCKKQTTVSHSCTESEIISLDVGLRMDGLLALNLWGTVIEVLRSTNNNVQPKHTSIQEIGATLHFKTKTQKVKRRQKDDQLSDCGSCAHQHTHSSLGESQLNIFEDNEAVIKMIIKGRSPTMRPVNPQSCSWLVIWQNQFGTPKSKSNMSTPKTNSLTFWPKEVTQEMNGITLFVCFDYFESLDVWL